MVAFICVIIMVVMCLSILQYSHNQQAPSGSGQTGNFTLKGGVNNPGFLVSSSAGWLGSRHVAGQKFENFTTIELGVRAWYINLFNKIKKGKINSPEQMIDVLTPAGSENSEQARDNYKSSVKKSRTWYELAQRVFDFEANSDWIGLTPNEKTRALYNGLKSAVTYCNNGVIPDYTW